MNRIELAYAEAFRHILESVVSVRRRGILANKLLFLLDEQQLDAIDLRNKAKNISSTSFPVDNSYYTQD